jgi:thioredoxin reductase (NADPH)
MGRFRRRTLVVDDGRGRWSYGQRTDNYLGFPRGLSARRLQSLGQAQAARFGVRFRAGTVRGLARSGRGFRLRLARGSVAARTVIWAAGVQDRWPSFPGARRLVGKRLFWCIVCDGWRTRDRRVLLVGRDDAAGRVALQFLTYTRDVALVLDGGRVSGRCRRKLDAQGLAVCPGRIERVRVRDDGLQVALADGRVLEVDYIFSLLGHTPRTEPLRALGVSLGPRGHVRADDKGRTSLPGVFAAGDVTDAHAHQVVSAVFEGAEAALAANHALYPPSRKVPK